MDVSEELIEEVFARFGGAYYYSEVLHRGLCSVYALMTFQSKRDVTRARMEEKLAYASSLTLGQLIEATKNLFPIELRQHLEIAQEKRNYLAHQFWFERCHLMFSDSGLHELLLELTQLVDLFSALDEDIERYLEPTRREFGVTDEVIQMELDKLISGEIEEPLIQQRKPKKQERVVRAWDVRTDDGGTAQIFETDDGCLWQFCDVGLGWSFFKKPAEGWTLNEKIQKHLPATINPRPPILEPWNYEFTLAKGFVLWVKPGKKERSYTWSLKLTKVKPV